MGGHLVKLELEFTENEWDEIVEAVASKARLVGDRHYGDFDPLDGFDPDEWAHQLERIHRKLKEKVDEI